MKDMDLKIGLYVEELDLNPDDKKGFEKADKQFYNALKLVKQSDIDLLVFPESCDIPFDDFSSNSMKDIALEISKMTEKAVIVGFTTDKGAIGNVYANAFNKVGETDIAFYYKHIFSQLSPFDYQDYESNITNYFPIINLKGKRIGMTICYDLTQPVFSRMYGKERVDIIINNTGSDVNLRKWNNYLRTRAIENNCYAICVDGYSIYKKMMNDKEVQGLIATGYNNEGKRLATKSLMDGKEVDSDSIEKNNIYVIDFSLSNNQDTEYIIPQDATVPKFQDLKLPATNIQSIIDTSKEIETGLYIQEKTIKGEIYTLVYCVINDNDIIKPEIVLNKLYSKKLAHYSNKRYFLISKYKHCEEKHFNSIVATILSSRVAENYITLIFESDIKNICLQVTRTKGLQLVKNVNGYYSIDLDRAKGPDHLWEKNGTYKKMCRDWRPNFEKLIEYINN